MAKEVKKDNEIVEDVVDVIVDEALEQGKTTDEIVEDVVEESKKDESLIIEESKKNKKKYDGDLRGFKTYEEAIDYPNTKAFVKLDKGCQNEYKNWLKTIM